MYLSITILFVAKCSTTNHTVSLSVWGSNLICLKLLALEVAGSSRHLTQTKLIFLSLSLSLSLSLYIYIYIQGVWKKRNANFLTIKRFRPQRGPALSSPVGARFTDILRPDLLVVFPPPTKKVFLLRLDYTIFLPNQWDILIKGKIRVYKGI